MIRIRNNAIVVHHKSLYIVCHSGLDPESRKAHENNLCKVIANSSLLRKQESRVVENPGFRIKCGMTEKHNSIFGSMTTFIA